MRGAGGAAGQCIKFTKTTVAANGEETLDIAPGTNPDDIGYYVRT